VSQNTRRRRQPIRERARPAQRPRIPDPQAPSDDLNKLPTLSVRGRWLVQVQPRVQSVRFRVRGAERTKAFVAAAAQAAWMADSGCSRRRHCAAESACREAHAVRLARRQRRAQRRGDARACRATPPGGGRSR